MNLEGCCSTRNTSVENPLDAKSRRYFYRAHHSKEL